MSDLDTLFASHYNKVDQARFFSDFLFNLTIGVRAVHILERSDIVRQLYGMNQVFHAVIPFITLSISQKSSSHTMSSLAETIRDIGISYDIARYVDEAWITAQRSTRNQTS